MAVIRHEHDRLASAPCTCDCAQCRAGACSLQSTGEEARLRRQLRGAAEENERLRTVNEGLRASLRKMREDGEEGFRGAAEEHDAMYEALVAQLGSHKLAEIAYQRKLATKRGQ